MNLFNFTQEFTLMVAENNQLREYKIFINFGDWCDKNEIKIDGETYSTTEEVKESLTEFFMFKNIIRDDWMSGNTVDWKSAHTKLQELNDSVMSNIVKTMLNNTVN